MKKINLLIAALHAGALALVAGPGIARAQDAQEIRAYMSALSHRHGRGDERLSHRLSEFHAARQRARRLDCRRPRSADRAVDLRDRSHHAPRPADGDDDTGVY